MVFSRLFILSIRSLASTFSSSPNALMTRLSSEDDAWLACPLLFVTCFHSDVHVSSQITLLCAQKKKSFRSATGGNVPMKATEDLMLLPAWVVLQPRT